MPLGRAMDLAPARMMSCPWKFNINYHLKAELDNVQCLNSSKLCKRAFELVRKKHWHKRWRRTAAGGQREEAELRGLKGERPNMVLQRNSKLFVSYQAARLQAEILIFASSAPRQAKVKA